MMPSNRAELRAIAKAAGIKPAAEQKERLVACDTCGGTVFRRRHTVNVEIVRDEHGDVDEPCAHSTEDYRYYCTHCDAVYHEYEIGGLQAIDRQESDKKCLFPKK